MCRDDAGKQWLIAVAMEQSKRPLSPHGSPVLSPAPLSPAP